MNLSRKISTHIFLVESNTARQPLGGVARYTRHMVRGLHAKYGDRLAVCTGLDRFPHSLRRIYLPLRYPWRYSSRLLYEGTNLLEKALLYSIERSVKPAVIFNPYYGPLASFTPQVFTVYDLMLHLYPEHLNPTRRRLQLEHMRRCFVRAAAILCISNSTKADLLRLHPYLDPTKLHVVPLGVSESFFQPVKPSNSSRPYFLFVGTREGPKNFCRLLEAYAICGLTREFDLHVVSPRNDFGDGWSPAEQSLIRSRNLENSVRLNVKVSDEDLAVQYARAAAFICPSEYEGFGLPVLEAFASGTIVACSRTSSLPEAGGTAAFYFDPLDVESMVRALTKIVQLTSAERAERIRQGQLHARSLSWARCISKTCEILDSVACAKTSSN